MKTKFLSTVTTFILLLFVTNQLIANATPLTPEIKSILDNVKNECKLSDAQSATFTTDYVEFLNATDKNNKTYTENESKKNSENQKVLFATLSKLKTYLNQDQQTTLIKLIQAGKLTPTASIPANNLPAIEPNTTTPNTGSTTQTTTITPTTTQPTVAVTPTPTVQVEQPKVTVPNTTLVSPKSLSNVAGLFDQMKEYLKVTPDQYTKTMTILKDYDTKITGVKNANANNPQKTTTEINAVNKAVIPQLKAVLKQDQINTLVAGVTMQENILSGKNITPQQKSMLDKIRTQYNLNDAQSMAVIMVLVQGKVRGDAIQKIKPSNPDLAKKETTKLLQDIDTQLKNSLTTEQYTKVKFDLEKLLVKK
jgi:hypothetical protein